MKTRRIQLTIALTVVALSLGAVIAHAQSTGADAPRSPAVDPFKALVGPAPVVAPQPPEHQPLPPPKPEEPVKPAPVTFKVTAVATDSGTAVAVLEYEGQTYIVQTGTQVPSSESPVFDVKQVTSYDVEVYDRKAGIIVRRELGAQNR